MKIWIFNHYAVAPTQFGGTRHFSFAQRLKARGHEPLIIASNYDHFNHRFWVEGLTEPRLQDVEGVPFVWVPTRAYEGNGKARALNMVDYARGLKKVLKVEGAGRPDVVLGSSPHLFSPYVAQRLARRLGVPFVLEVRDVWPQTLVDAGNLTDSHPFIRGLARLEKLLYRTSDHIVSLLPGAVDHCVALGAKRENVTWVPNGIDLTFVDSAVRPIEQRDDFYLMFAGSFGLVYDLDTVLDAAKLLRGKSIRFGLIGDGVEKPRLMERAKAEDIDNVAFLDAVPRRDVYGKLADADAFLMLLKELDIYRWGISPNKLFDYMSLERPMIFGVNSINSPIEEAHCGLRIKPGSPEALAEAALTLARMPVEEREAMGKRGRSYLEKNFDFDGLTDRLESVFLRLVEK